MSKFPPEKIEIGGKDKSKAKTSRKKIGLFWSSLISLTLAFIFMIVLPFSALVWYKSNYSSGDFRYRITVEVEVDDTVQTGSGVLAAEFSLIPKSLPGRSGPSSVRGEAVVVDIGNRGALFLLVKGNSSGTGPELIPQQVFKFDLNDPLAIRRLADMDAKGEIPFDRLPMLVRFRDISDPKTVELVDPNDLAASFGPGVSLKRVTIQTTKDPVTTGIDKRLVWLKRPRRSSISGRRGSEIPRPGPEQLLSGSDFRRRTIK